MKLPEVEVLCVNRGTAFESFGMVTNCPTPSAARLIALPAKRLSNFSRKGRAGQVKANLLRFAVCLLGGLFAWRSVGAREELLCLQWAWSRLLGRVGFSFRALWQCNG